MQAFRGAAPGGIDDVDVGLFDLQLTVPSVSGVSVSGTNIFAIISVPGAVMITAVSRCCASMPNAM